MPWSGPVPKPTAFGAFAEHIESLKEGLAIRTQYVLTILP